MKIDFTIKIISSAVFFISESIALQARKRRVTTHNNHLSHFNIDYQRFTTLLQMLQRI